MTLTTIDPRPALVVVDLQKGVMNLPTVHSAAGIVQRSARLADAFRRHGYPVVLVNAAGRAPGRTQVTRSIITPGPDWADLVDELRPKPEDYRVTKVRWGAFHGTSLDTFLRDRGVTQVFITGIATSAGVESTARGAYEHSYNVVLVTDAMTDSDAEVHRNSIERIFPRLGETATTDEVLAALERVR